MHAKTMMSLLLVSAAFVTPAAANWFSRPNIGINLNIGSAPNPTGDDIRRIEGYGALSDMEGKIVIGANGEELGYILAVDETAQLVDVQLPGDMAVAVSAYLMSNRLSRVDAPALSGSYMLALAAEQRRSIVAFNATP